MPADIPPAREPQAPDQKIAPRTPRPASGSETGALRIATLFGIPIRIHFTFILLLAWLVLYNVGGNARSSSSIWSGPLFVCTLFACVVLHELGHALVARSYGISTRDIVLYPIGGISHLEKQPAPRQELWISLAGPAVNVALAGLLYGLILAARVSIGAPRHSAAGNLLVSLLEANLLLAAFNLLPAFPMDGGRVLRAVIARMTNDVAATDIAARIGQAFAVLFGLLGLFAGQYLLVIIAVFVYIGAGQEASAFHTRAAMAGHRVSEAMVRSFQTISVGATLSEARDALLAGSQQDFPVVHGEEVVGVLSRGSLLRGFAEEGPQAYVAGAMQRDYNIARPEAPLDSVLTAAPTTEPILVMTDDSRETGALVGMLTQENLLEFLWFNRLTASK